MTSLIKYIKDQIVIASSDVINYCIKTSNVTGLVARKRVSRLPEEICKIKGKLVDNQVILFHKSNWNTPEYYTRLVELLSIHAKQHHAILLALKFHHGIIRKSKLASYSFSPINLVKGHRAFETVIQDLVSLKLIDFIDDFCVSNNTDITKNEKRAAGQNMAQDIIIKQFSEWAQNINLIAYNKSKYNAPFSNYQFGLVTPSYIKSLVQHREKLIPAFVVADVLVGNTIDGNTIDSLILKATNAEFCNKSMKFIYFVLTDKLDYDVHQKLKNAGIVTGILDDIFCEKYGETIKSIINLIANANTILREHPEQYLKIIEKIEALALGKTNNLKGDLFEMAVGFYHGCFCISLEIGKLVNDRKNEIDVYAVYQDKVIFAECKGYNRVVDDEYVDKWLSTRIGALRNWALSMDNLKNLKIEFEFWCTGGFSETSSKRLLEASTNVKKYQIRYYDYDSMLKLAKDKNVPKLSSLLSSYYKQELN